MAESRETNWNKVGALAGLGALIVAVITLGVMVWPLVFASAAQSQSPNPYRPFLTSWWPPVIIGVCVLVAAILHLLAAYVARGKNNRQSVSVITPQSGCSDGWLHDLASQQAKAIQYCVNAEVLNFGPLDLLRESPYIEFWFFVRNGSVFTVSLRGLSGVIHYAGEPLSGSVSYIKPIKNLLAGASDNSSVKLLLTKEDVAFVLNNNGGFSFHQLMSQIITSPPIDPQEIEFRNSLNNDALRERYPKLKMTVQQPLVASYFGLHLVEQFDIPDELLGNIVNMRVCLGKRPCETNSNTTNKIGRKRPLDVGGSWRDMGKPLREKRQESSLRTAA